MERGIVRWWYYWKLLDTVVLALDCTSHYGVVRNTERYTLRCWHYKSLLALHPIKSIWIWCLKSILEDLMNRNFGKKMVKLFANENNPSKETIFTGSIAYFSSCWCFHRCSEWLCMTQHDRAHHTMLIVIAMIWFSLLASPCCIHHHLCLLGSGSRGVLALRKLTPEIGICLS